MKKCRIKICKLLCDGLSASTVSPYETKKHVVQNLFNSLELRYVSMWRYAPETKTLHLGASTHSEFINSSILEINTPAGDVITQNRRFIHTPDISQDHRYCDKILINRLGLKDMYTFLIKENSLPSVIICIYPQHNLKDEEIEELCDALPLLYSPVNLSIEKHRLAIVQSIMKYIPLKKDLNSFIFKVTEVINKNIKMEATSLFLFEPVNHLFSNLCTFDIYGTMKRYPDSSYTSEDPYFEKIVKGNIIILHGEDAATVFSNTRFTEKKIKTYYTVVFVPIIDSFKKNKILGFIRCVNEINRSKTKDKDYFSINDKLAFSECASAISIGISNYLERATINRIFSDFEHEAEVPVEGIEAICERLKYPDKFPATKAKLESCIEIIEGHAMSLHGLLLQYSSHGLDNMVLQIDSTPVELLTDIIFPSVAAQELEIRKHLLPLRLNSDKNLRSIHFEKEDFYRIKKLYVDPVRMSQAFSNVLKNAVKYHANDKSSFEVEIRTYTCRKSFHIFICDVGIGISEDWVEQVFELDIRAPEALNSSAHGSGLGLYITRKSIEAHGGKVQILPRKNYTEYEIPTKYVTVVDIELPKKLYYEDWQ